MNARIRVKMCGITRIEDAAAAVEAGVDALGFIFFEKSPRFIDPEEARLIIEALPPFVDVVGVFVDKKRNEVEEIIDYCRLNYAQLHGTESPKYCERLARFAAPCQILKVLRVGPGDGLSVADITPYNPHVRGFLLDTFHKSQLGGTGKSFDWSRINQLKLQRPFILAGGLTLDNIAAAISAVQPYGVDINSGVEERPGCKDHELVRKMMQVIRTLEVNAGK